MFPGATIFPEGLAIGSTFDMPLVKSVCAAAAQEARSVGIHVLSTLVLELDRDPRMGRNEEAYTEDPYLYSRIAENIVQGAQGADIAAPDKVVALMTDFPTQSEPTSGLERGAIELSERSLRENFLPPWQAAITKSGALGVMAGYPEVEDVPSHGSEKWMNDVLREELGSIAVIGPNADNGLNQLGDYSPQVVPQHLTTVLEGILKEVSSSTRVIYAKGCEIIGGGKEGFAKAIEAAKQADAAVVVVGEHPRDGTHGVQPTDGEGYDVASLDLTGEQEDLVEAVVQTGKPTVVVLINGRPLSVRWIAEHVSAIVEAWEPGERGGQAVARILFGDDNPSGRLAITVPRSVGQLPVYYNYKPSKAYWLSRGWTHVPGYADMPGTPLYPFGYGLSYTEFKYSNLRIEPVQIYTGGNARVSVDVENTGKLAGVETVQLYLHERFAPVATPVKQLRGFERVALSPGEKKNVTFTLGPEDLQLLNSHMRWVVVPGTFDVMIGKSSADIAVQGSLQVKATGAESASMNWR